MRNSKLLARVDIPLYMVKVINERHILVAGGGGQANTGVKNSVEIYELLAPSHNVNSDGLSSSTCSARLVKRFLTDSRAIMSGTVFQNDRHLILAGGGINGECLLWRMRLISKPRQETVHINGNAGGGIRPNNNLINNDVGNAVRRRAAAAAVGVAGENNDGGNVAAAVGRRSRTNSEVVPESELGYTFEFTKLEAFKTDFSSLEEDAFVKVIRYNNNLSALVAGGADGHIRIWRYPNVTKLVDIPAHKDEIDDLDIHPLGNVIASVSRDGHGYIWDANTGKRQCELVTEIPVIKNSTQLVKYVMRSCRYGLVVDSNPITYKLFTVHNPASRHKPPYPAYLCKWDTNKYTVERLTSLGAIMVSSMAISDDGRFIGIGTQEGTVEIYIAFSLQKLYSYPRAHNIFVTGLEFLKTCPETQLLTGNNDSSLVSISVDRHLVIHSIPRQKTIGLTGSMICFAIVIFSIYIILELLGL
ncbi:prolactin regulatory element-binding protein-like [Panonychus citri]|uniref:prolactin regulatory element-binding protein-like n=1 Tax=Panonychus citri TaxID=50023 RepID=UPI002307CD7B|nr:prolactin regulatory element-binding protein-like [Panonychus citri]